MKTKKQTLMEPLDLWYLIREARLTQKQVAQKIGLSEVTITRYLKGFKPLTEEIQSKILKAIKELKR